MVVATYHNSMELNKLNVERRLKVEWLDSRMVGWLDGWMVGWMDGSSSERKTERVRVRVRETQLRVAFGEILGQFPRQVRQAAAVMYISS